MEVLRLLIFVALGLLVVLWLRRLFQPRMQRPEALDAHMPKQLVCGACGREYDPHKSGWLCPQCHK